MKKYSFYYKIIIIILSGIIYQPNLFSQKVVLNILDKTKGKAHLRFYKEPKIKELDFRKEKPFGEQKNLSDSTFQIVFNLENNNAIIFCSWLYNNKYILLTAGDSLNVIVDYKNKNRFNVIFHGKNEENYNTSLTCETAIKNRNIITKIKNKKTIKESINFIDSTYCSNISILKKEPKSVARNIKIHEAKAKYITSLFYINDSLTHSQILTIKDKLFGNKIKCEHSLLMQSKKYRAGFVILSMLLTKNIKTDKKLMASTDTINKYFKGELLNFLLAHNFSNIYWFTSVRKFLEKGKKKLCISIKPFKKYSLTGK